MDYQQRLALKRSAAELIKELHQQPKQKNTGCTKGLRMVRIDANTLVFSKEFALSDDQIRENWLKKHKKIRASLGLSPITKLGRRYQ